MYWNDKTNRWTVRRPKHVPAPPRKKPAPKPPRKRWLAQYWGPEPHVKPYCTCAEAEDDGLEWYGHRWSRHDYTGACEALICDCTQYRPSAKQPPVYDPDADPIYLGLERFGW